ncbi:2-amino-4-hydroxy-6-hydroxymethyldihydropteridine diphosphokinase [candidate division WOR-3 bacterium]|nr:2-amino-4-hydroxy-6-hydroxymethyldihydropteridine diphosphokinase [candidate division WOR-3 bacterium]
MPVSKLEEKDIKKTVYIAIGSNRGSKRENLHKSLEYLMKIEKTDVISISPFYDTEPYGYKEQPQFLNGVAKIKTTLLPLMLLKELKRIEKKMGRENGERWRQRIIDLDILFYNCIIFNNKDLVIPHPDLHNRSFVLKPMNDLNPDFKHPVFKKTVRQLLEELHGKI